MKDMQKREALKVFEKTIMDACEVCRKAIAEAQAVLEAKKAEARKDYRGKLERPLKLTMS